MFLQGLKLKELCLSELLFLSSQLREHITDKGVNESTSSYNGTTTHD